MKKTLYLVRHGQTLFNKLGEIQGWCDSPLTELGILQAQATAQYFRQRNIVFTHAYSSTSERATDTLEIITDMPYQRVKGLKEWNFGKFEGESERLNPPFPFGEFFKNYGGESQDEFRSRIKETIQKLMHQENHDVVLMVCHRGVLRNFYIIWQAYTEIEFDGHSRNGCVFKYEYDNGIFRLVELFNEDIVK